MTNEIDDKTAAERRAKMKAMANETRAKIRQLRIKNLFAALLKVTNPIRINQEAELHEHELDDAAALIDSEVGEVEQEMTVEEAIAVLDRMGWPRKDQE